MLMIFVENDNIHGVVPLFPYLGMLGKNYVFAHNLA